MRKETLLEMLGNISDKHISEFADIPEQSEKRSFFRKTWGRRAAAVIVFAGMLVAFLLNVPKEKGSGNWKDSIGGSSQSATEVIDNTGYNPTEVYSSEEQEKKEEENVDFVLEVNQLETPPVSMDMDVQYEFYMKLPYDVWQTVQEDFYTSVGISYDDFILKVPENFSLANFYSLSTRGYKDSGLEDKYQRHDYVFEYHTERSGNVTIAICSFESPLRDCFFECKNPKVTEVNGIKVRVYQYENTFFVEYMYEGVYYDIETQGVGTEELQELLGEILK